MKKLKLIPLILILIAVLSSCSVIRINTSTKATTEVPETPVIIKGLGDKDITLTVEMLKQITPIETPATSVDSKGKKTDYQVKGAKLQDVAAKFGTWPTEPVELKVTSVDSYEIIISSEMVSTRTIIIAYEMNGEPVVRLVIPEERSMYWVRDMKMIEVQPSSIVDNSKKADKIIVLETAVNTINKVKDGDYEKVSVSEFFTKYGITKVDKLTLTASDGLEKTEDYNTFSGNFFITNGDEKIKWGDDSISKGMRVKKLASINVDKIMIVSTLNVENIKTEINKLNADGKNILFTALDGKTLTKPSTALNGLTVILSNDQVNITIDGETLSGLVTAEVKS